MDEVRQDVAQDALISAGMLADRLRPIVLGGESACIDRTPMIPLHRATVTSIYMHLERLAAMDGETTLGALEWALAARGREATHPTLPEQLPEAGITIGEEG